MHEGVGVLVGCLFCWGCGVVPVLKWALEEDEWLGVGCGEPVCGWVRARGCVFCPVGEVADGVCWCGEWGGVCPGCGQCEEGVELCWCGCCVVAVNNGGGSGVAGGVGVCRCAACVGDGGWGWCVWVLVVLFPVVGGGGVGE